MVDTDRCNRKCYNSPEMCGGDGGFMSVYGGETMTAGTPKDIHFNVELNSGVSKIKGFFDLFNLAIKFLSPFYALFDIFWI